jgi:hypothetical protein
MIVVGIIDNFAVGGIVIGLFLASFAAGLCYEESAVRSVICWMATKSISFPGLIWEFSIDGFIWLIAMKLLFWVIGAIAGILFAIICVIAAIIIAPFALPISIVSYIKGE